MPHLALPTLTAYLRARGVEVIQRDLNVEVFDEILTRPYIQNAVARLRQEYGPQGNRASRREQTPKPEMIQWALRQGRN